MPFLPSDSSLRDAKTLSVRFFLSPYSLLLTPYSLLLSPGFGCGYAAMIHLPQREEGKTFTRAQNFQAKAVQQINHILEEV